MNRGTRSTLHIFVLVCTMYGVFLRTSEPNSLVVCHFELAEVWSDTLDVFMTAEGGKKG